MATIPSVFASQIVNSFKVAQEQGLDDTFEAYYKHIMAVGDIKVEPKERERAAELQEGIDRYMDESQGVVLFSKTEEEKRADAENKRQFVANVKPLITESKKKNHKNDSTSFGKAQAWLVAVSELNGLSIKGYKHAVDVDGLVHINNRHGLGNEFIEKQIPVTETDIENIPDIVSEPDYLVYGFKTTKGNDTVGYLKTMEDGTTYYVEEVRTHKKTLSAKTMFRFEGMLSSDFVNQKLRSTSETLPSAITFVPAFNQSISSGNTNVKRVDEDGKLYSINERGEERPYSNKELDKMLDNAEENKEALIDLYYNHRHKYLGRNGDRLETQVTNKYIGWGLEESNWSKERRRAIWETEPNLRLTIRLICQ